MNDAVKSTVSFWNRIVKEWQHNDR